MLGSNIFDLATRLPPSGVSRLVGFLAERRRPRVAVQTAIKLFARLYNIQPEQLEKPFKDYSTLGDFFVRRLKPGAHKINPDPLSVVAPCDSVLQLQGPIQDGMALQAKGIKYSLAELLDDETKAAGFDGGWFMTFYLSPRDYHRVHAPLAGTIVRADHLPGRLFSVKPTWTQMIHQLFPRNERVVTYLETPTAGEIALVMVGAVCVGSIRMAFDQRIQGNDRSSRRPQRFDYEAPHMVTKGGELGAFRLGSTVILLFGPNQIQPMPSLEGKAIRMGKRTATLLKQQKKRGRQGRSIKKKTKG